MSPRRRRELEETPPLPLSPGPVSNGEFVPDAPSSNDVALGRAMREHIDTAARRAGIDRRQFLQGAGAVAASLAAINVAACSDQTGAPAPSSTSTSGSPTSSSPVTSSTPGSSASSTSGPAATFIVPPATDVAACESALGSQGEFIFDIHTHHVMPHGAWRKTAPDTVNLLLGMTGACGASDRFDCVNRTAYLRDLFLASDTTVALLTDVPNSGPSDAPMPFADAVRTQELAAELMHGGAPRVLVHNVIAPNVGHLDARLDEMTAAVSTGHVAAFKVYTAWSRSGPGWSLDDPAIGLPVLQQAHDLGVTVFCAHKGLPLVHFDASHNLPDDMVAASRVFPDMQFVVFHGGWLPSHVEGPYNPGAPIGIDRLLAALDRHGVGPNENLWVDLGTVWRRLIPDPTQAAHALGKLLLRVGQDRVLWGTDSIWWGSPQAQIMALRAFTISPAWQERYGYPALTADVKRRILGLNAARLFGLDPTAVRCKLDADRLAAAQPEALALRLDGALPSPWTPNGPTTRREMLQWLTTTPWTPA